MGHRVGMSSACIPPWDVPSVLKHLCGAIVTVGHSDIFRHLLILFVLRRLGRFEPRCSTEGHAVSADSGMAHGRK